MVAILPLKTLPGKAVLVASTSWPWRIRPKKISGTLNSISSSARSSRVVSTVSSSTRAPMSTPRMPTTPANGARTVRSASSFLAPSSRALCAGIGRLELVDGGLGHGVVGAQLAGAIERQLGLAPHRLGFRDIGLLGQVVEADQHRALLDMLARREVDLGDPARAQRHDVDRLARQRRAYRLDPLADRARFRLLDLDRDRARAAPHRGRGLAVGLIAMIGHGTAADRQQQGGPDR